MERIDIHENNLYLVFEITDQQEVKFLHMSPVPFQEESIRDAYEKTGFRLLELSCDGFDRPQERHGGKYTVTAPGYRMLYAGHKDYRTNIGRKIEIVTCDKETGLYVTSHFQFYDGTAVLRCHSVLENKGEEAQGVSYITSFNLNGVEKEGLLNSDEKMRISLIHQSWMRELRWKEYTLTDLGIGRCQKNNAMRSSKAVQIANTGNWSTKEFLPMGWITNQETKSHLFWQIEHNGSWFFEISDQTNHYYLQLCGPTENQSHWHQTLRPGDVFETVPVSVGAVLGDTDQIIKELTTYRRLIRRKNQDNENLPIIFNDYMHCYWGEPTTKKELPLIALASELGCEYYCIDAGWYANGDWWDGVGEWVPSTERFPGGIKEVLDYIREKNMIPGLWLELEVMGIHCPLASTLPDECFFIRHNKKVYDRSRYQLDFRHPLVISHVNAVVDRLVHDYGVGYIKMDYNIEPGLGTQVDAQSFGDGLLQHERAYLAWLDSIFEKYPDLVIENCSSGGLRMDYALLKRHSIQSTSDQEDYRYYASIAANSPIGVTMEQSAIWSCPAANCEEEEVVFNMVNALMMRVHQSGNLLALSGAAKKLIQEGLGYYKSIRTDIKNAVPFWPLGFSNFEDDWICAGLKCGDKTYVAVWRLGGRDTIELPVKHLINQAVRVRCAYPSYEACGYAWHPAVGKLIVKIERYPAARFFEMHTELAVNDQPEFVNIHDRIVKVL